MASRLECYGHLIDQFWSPATNKRDDQYGGSLENRMRFAIEVLQAIRDRVGPDFIVGTRMVCDEDWDRGLSKAEGLEIARRLVASGLIDFVNVIKRPYRHRAGALARHPRTWGALGAPPRFRRRGAQRHQGADLPRGPHPGCGDGPLCHRERQARPRRHDAGPHGRPAHHAQGGRKSVRRTSGPASAWAIASISIYSEDGSLHPQSRDRARGHDASRGGAARPVRAARLWWRGPGRAGLRPREYRPSAATMSWCSRRPTGPAARSGSRPGSRTPPRNPRHRGLARGSNANKKGGRVPSRHLRRGGRVFWPKNPDIVVIATGGVPNTSFLDSGEELVTTKLGHPYGGGAPRPRP